MNALGEALLDSFRKSIDANHVSGALREAANGGIKSAAHIEKRSTISANNITESLFVLILKPTERSTPSGLRQSHHMYW
jgi:hypothetical protein